MSVFALPFLLMITGAMQLAYAGCCDFRATFPSCDHWNNATCCRLTFFLDGTFFVHLDTITITKKKFCHNICKCVSSMSLVNNASINCTYSIHYFLPLLVRLFEAFCIDFRPFLQFMFLLFPIKNN